MSGRLPISFVLSLCTGVALFQDAERVEFNSDVLEVFDAYDAVL